MEKQEYTDYDLQFMRDNYWTMSKAQIAERLGRTIGSVAGTMAKIGLKGKPNPKNPKGRGRKRQVSKAKPVQQGNFIVVGAENAEGLIPLHIGADTVVYTTAENLTNTLEKWKTKTTERTKFYEL